MKKQIFISFLIIVLILTMDEVVRDGARVTKGQHIRGR